MIGRLLFVLCAATIPAAASAQPITHPIWAETPDAEWDASARAQFQAALARRGLGAPEIVAIAPPATTPLATLLDQGMSALHASAFDKAVSLLGEAAQKALATGGAGLAPGQAASLFFHQAMAIQLAAGVTYSEPFDAISPPEAKAAYLRAAVLGGGLALDEAAAQPLVEASWRLAKTLAAARPRTSLTVNAHPRAKITVDNHGAMPSPATIPALSAGEHFILVEEPGHAPWTTALALGGSANSIDVPATPLLVYDAKAAASRALAKAAAFALVGQLHLGDKIEIDLRLVDAKSGELRAAAAVALAAGTNSPDLVAAVLRLDETAGQADLARRAAGTDGEAHPPLSLAPPPPRATTQAGPELTTDTEGWLRAHWPLATAIGAAIGTTVALGIVVAKDHR